ncbi:FAD binding domain-containing protein, partial [Salmonella enterica subsp. enterica serovar Typhimurium]
SAISTLSVRPSGWNRVNVAPSPPLARSSSSSTLGIGATTTEAAVERSDEVARAVPLLARATPYVGHFQIRNRGTLGGSIAHADPAAEY